MFRQRCCLAWLSAFCCVQVLLFAAPTFAQPVAGNEPPSRDEPGETAQETPDDEIEANFIEMLSGATLEGTYTSTAPGSDPTKLSQEKYTIGEVKKIAGNIWLIPA